MAPSMDPGWRPLIVRASAVVMETGGYLSHGAIVAREYGLPAVVNIPGLLSLRMAKPWRWMATRRRSGVLHNRRAPRFGIPAFLGPHLDRMIACPPTCHGPDDLPKSPAVTAEQELPW